MRYQIIIKHCLIKIGKMNTKIMINHERLFENNIQYSKNYTSLIFKTLLLKRYRTIYPLK